MALFSVFDISGSAMEANSMRLNTTASNLANANSVASSERGAYKARHPMFKTIHERAVQFGAKGNEPAAGGVRVTAVVESEKPARKEYRPEHPAANEEGFVFVPDVNVVEQMADMISASRSYQANVNVSKTTKDMLSSTLQLGQ